MSDKEFIDEVVGQSRAIARREADNASNLKIIADLEARLKACAKKRASNWRQMKEARADLRKQKDISEGWIMSAAASEKQLNGAQARINTLIKELADARKTAEEFEAELHAANATITRLEDRLVEWNKAYSDLRLREALSFEAAEALLKEKQARDKWNLWHRLVWAFRP